MPEVVGTEDQRQHRSGYTELAVVVGGLATMGQQQRCDLGRIHATAAADADHQVGPEGAAGLHRIGQTLERKLRQNAIEDTDLQPGRDQPINQFGEHGVGGEPRVCNHQSPPPKRNGETRQAMPLPGAENQIARQAQCSEQ